MLGRKEKREKTQKCGIGKVETVYFPSKKKKDIATGMFFTSWRWALKKVPSSLMV